MIIIDTVFTNIYQSETLVIGDEYWFAVRGRTYNGGNTERSIALQVTAQSGNVCPWDYDMSLTEISTIQVGRANTSLALSNSELVTIELKNLGINTIDSFEISYQVDNGNLETEIIYETLPSGDASEKIFTAAADFLGGKYLKDCVLYVTLEPCQMCAGASYWAQIGKIVYGASEPERGFKKLKTTVHPKTTVVQGVLEHECSQLLKRFFVEKRNLN